MSEKLSDKNDDLVIREAVRQDDPELRRLLRVNPMPGAITVSMQREPDFFLGASVEGDDHKTITGELGDTGELIGLGSFSFHSAFINGHKNSIGYLSQLRIDKDFRGVGRWLRDGYSLMKEMTRDRTFSFFTTTIIEDNYIARRVLTSGRPGLPTYREQEIFSTLILPLGRSRKISTPAGITFLQAREEHLPEIAECLQRVYTNYQFAPCWTAYDLNSLTRTRGLNADDFLIAQSGGRIVGCVGIWDQRGFKQTVVHGYSGALRWIRPAANLALSLAGGRSLPAPGEALQYAYLSHLAVDPDVDKNGELLVALIRRACSIARARGISYVSVGLAERHPHYTLLKKSFRSVEYRSLIYTVYWEDDLAAIKAVNELDGRIPFVEHAVL